jgi:hypothetical protein
VAPESPTISSPREYRYKADSKSQWRIDTDSRFECNAAREDCRAPKNKKLGLRSALALCPLGLGPIDLR